MILSLSFFFLSLFLSSFLICLASIFSHTFLCTSSTNSLTSALCWCVLELSFTSCFFVCLFLFVLEVLFLLFFSCFFNLFCTSLELTCSQTCRCLRGPSTIICLSVYSLLFSFFLSLSSLISSFCYLRERKRERKRERDQPPSSNISLPSTSQHTNTRTLPLFLSLPLWSHGTATQGFQVQYLGSPKSLNTASPRLPPLQLLDLEVVLHSVKQHKSNIQ